MAIASDASSLTQSPGFDNSVTVSHTVSGTDRVLLVAVHCRTDVITGVTYNGASMTFLGKNINSGVVGVSWYYLVAPSTGTNDVIVSFSAFTLSAVAVWSLTGVNQTSPIATSDFSATLDGFGTGSGSQSLSTSSGQWLVAAFATSADGSAFAATDGATLLLSGSHTDGSLGSTMVVYDAGAGTFGASWTTSTNWRAGALVLNPVADAIPWWQPNAFFWFPNPAGSSTYNESTSESVAVTDTLTGLLTIAAAIAETAAATDAQTGLLIIAGSTSESAAATDAPAATLTLSTAVAESAAATDSQTGLLTAVGAVSESAAATDSQTGLGVFTRDVAESAAVSDTQTGALTIAAAIAESMAIADTQTGGLFYAVTIAETMSIADTQTGLLTMLCDRAEVMSIADTPAATAAFVVAVTESVAATESSSAVAVIAAAVAETIAASDSQTGGSLFAVTIDESVSIADATSVQVAIAASVAEAVSIAESSNSVLLAVAAVVETIATQDIQDASGPSPPGSDEFRVGGAAVTDIVQTLNVATIYHTQKKTG